MASDLIKSILVIHPLKRLKVKQIKVHPWMYYHTKNYQLPKPPNCRHKEGLIYQILDKHGFARESIESYIRKKKHNKMTALFSLYERKNTLKLEGLILNNAVSTSVPKTPMKLMRRPGRTSQRMRSMTPRSSVEKNHSF